ncbi:hypothetical protein [Anaerostipes sp.]|uniref:hypothetical protein n=1 Tax=Anaerostipes sp. TaxID=1872530 RepID=UPI0025B9C8FE|nr:hypothetical protein [Anaerostipes sp.]MBS7007890.1 hypothetical protein [Anaerostipes sp.]
MKRYGICFTSIIVAVVLCTELIGFPAAVYAGNIKNADSIAADIGAGRRARTSGMDESFMDAGRFASMDEASMYLMYGDGMYTFTQSYPKDHPDRLIELRVREAGSLILLYLQEDEKAPVPTLLDGRKRPAGSRIPDGAVMLKAKPGTYYVRLPADYSTVFIAPFVIKDDPRNLSNETSYIQSGQGKYTYHTFHMAKRGTADITASPVIKQTKPVTFFIQRKEKGRWKNIGRQQKSYFSSETGTVVYGLKKGSYRIAAKSGKDQGYSLCVIKTYIKSGYKTQKKKARTLKRFREQYDLYTVTEKASRWYRISVPKKRKKISVEAETYMNSGKIKFTVYKKGRKKPVKSLTLSGEKIKRFSFKGSKGTYYIKVSKSGKQANGSYWLYQY